MPQRPLAVLNNLHLSLSHDTINIDRNRSIWALGYLDPVSMRRQDENPGGARVRVARLLKSTGLRQALSIFESYLKHYMISTVPAKPHFDVDTWKILPYEEDTDTVSGDLYSSLW